MLRSPLPTTSAVIPGSTSCSPAVRPHITQHWASTHQHCRVPGASTYTAVRVLYYTQSSSTPHVRRTSRCRAHTHHAVHNIAISALHLSQQARHFEAASCSSAQQSYAPLPLPSAPVPPPHPLVEHRTQATCECWRLSSRPRPLKAPRVPSHTQAAPQIITPQRPRLPLPDGESGFPEGWPGGTRLAAKRAGIVELSSRSR